MPSWRTHIFLNIILFIVWLKFLFPIASVGIFYPIVVFVFVIIASVFPDIDTTKSKIRDWISLLLATLITIFYLLNFQVSNWLRISVYFFGLYLFLRFFPTPHRKLTHTFLVSFVFSSTITGLLWLVFVPSISVAVLTFVILYISYNSHLILDKVIKTTK